ncbi:hypothetical protein CHUAL_006178 [Chamberlinius hualienensis]
MSSSININNKRRVAVVGGGVIGISSALAVVQRVPNLSLTVIAESFSPDTTGDGAAGLWMPYLLGKGLKQLTSEWAKQTFSFLQDLFLSDAESTGISLVTGYAFDDEDEVDLFWKDLVLGLSPMSSNELNLVGASKGFKFTTFITECRKLLPYLMKKLEAHGVTFIKRKLNSLDDIVNDYDVIINCPGVKASLLVQDADVHPIRGQIVKVSAPWVKMFMINQDNYIIPNSEFVVLGGTHQRGNWNLEPNPEDRKHIMEGCTKILPSLKNARVVGEWVGLRPGRSQVRLEVQKIKEFPSKLVVHNYGHGGSGVTVFWGCAQHVARLVEHEFNQPINSRL